MKRILLLCILLLTAQSLFVASYPLPLTPYCMDDEMVDCIAAVINDRVITLVDLEFMNAFGLYEDDIKSGAGDPLPLILEKVIDQRVVLDMTREKISVGREEIDQAVSELTQKLGKEEVQRRLSQFGARAEDLRSYLEEKILCRKIISQRFSQSALVSLQEIELYYEKNYLPTQEKLGLKPEPMMQILNSIEALIKEQKTSQQVNAWIKSLRGQADIEVREDCLKQKRSGEEGG